ncbi:hypothetical protein MTP99_008773 [Tenebrio molitor]|jgi:hypothetical protein|nr:hypothetical protein MTP99_008773 [Tenebrio molitor]
MHNRNTALESNSQKGIPGDVNDLRVQSGSRGLITEPESLTGSESAVAGEKRKRLFPNERGSFESFGVAQGSTLGPPRFALFTNSSPANFGVAQGRLWALRVSLCLQTTPLVLGNVPDQLRNTTETCSHQLLFYTF